MSNSSKKTFQLTSISQNDPGSPDGSKLYAIVKAYGSELQAGSFPTGEKVHLPIPPTNGNPPPSPTWFMAPLNHDGEDNRYFEISIVGPEGYPPLEEYRIEAADVEKWGDIRYGERQNQIIRAGKYGIFGFAQNPTNANLIYSVTGGVYFPKK